MKIITSALFFTSILLVGCNQDSSINNVILSESQASRNAHTHEQVMDDSNLVPAIQYWNTSRQDYFTAVGLQEIIDAGKDAGGYSLEAVDFCISKVPTGEAQLELYWSEELTDNYSSTKFVENYRDARSQGYFLPKSTYGVIPVYQFYNPTTNDHRLSTRPPRMSGYTKIGLEGYAYPAIYCAGKVPEKSDDEIEQENEDDQDDFPHSSALVSSSSLIFSSSSQAVHIVPSSSSSEIKPPLSSSSEALPSSSSLELPSSSSSVTSCVVPQTSGLLPAVQYYSTQRKDHFIAVNAQEFIDAGKDGGGYVFIDTSFYVLPLGNSETTSLTLIWSDLEQDNSSTTQLRLPLNYRYARNQGYVYTNPVAGTVPLILYYNTLTSDYLTLPESDLNRFNLEGYQVQAVLGYVVPAHCP